MYPGKVLLPHVPTRRWEWGVGRSAIPIFIGSGIAVFQQRLKPKRYGLGHIICPQKLSIIGQRLDCLFGDSLLTSLWISRRGDAKGLLPLQRRLSDLCTRCDASGRNWSESMFEAKKCKEKRSHDFSHPFSGHSFMERRWKITICFAGWSRFCVGGLCVATAWALGTLS